MKRQDADKAYTWKMEHVFESDEKFLEEYEEVSELIKNIDKYKNHLGESASTLYEYFVTRDEYDKRVDGLYFYAHQRLHEDLGNATYQNYAGKTMNLVNQWMMSVSFEEPELIEIGEERIREYMKEEPALILYERYLYQIFRAKEHVLSKECSELLAMCADMANGPSDIFAKFSNVDITFPKIKDDNDNDVRITHGNYIKYLESRNRDVRKAAFEAMYETYEKYGNLMASVYNSSVKKDAFYAKAQRYSSAIEMELDNNEIPLSVYDNLIEAVHRYLPAMHRYVELRKRLMGYDELHMYDIYTPIVDMEDKKYSFNQAKDIVSEALEPMGEDYLGILNEGFCGGWIDVYENEGKRSGAYSWSYAGCHPYVLLNYQDNLDSVFTLIHEMGHAIHSYYSNASQPYVYSSYRIFVAEVASICNESLLLHYLIENANDNKEKAYYINNYLEKFRGTLFRQVMFAEFEKITHEMVENGETLTKENLSELYYDLNKKYYGDSIVVDKLIEMEWARIPHFYTPFYVYQYSTGFAAAIALSAGIISEGEEAVKRYISFLKGGCSMSPIELLKIAGVDMTSGEPVDNALKIFEKLVKQMEEIV